MTGRLDFGCELRLKAALLSIEPFQGSRWRLRRTRQIWILNAVLVLAYQSLRAIRSCLDVVLRSTEMLLHLSMANYQFCLSARVFDLLIPLLECAISLFYSFI